MAVQCAARRLRAYAVCKAWGAVRTGRHARQDACDNCVVEYYVVCCQHAQLTWYMQDMRSGTLHSVLRAQLWHDIIMFQKHMVVECADGRLTASSVNRTCDALRTGLRARLAEMRPVELVLPAGALSSATAKALCGSLPGVRTNWLPSGSAFWDAERTLQELDAGGYFGASTAEAHGSWPPLLQVRSAELCLCTSAAHANLCCWAVCL